MKTFTTVSVGFIDVNCYLVPSEADDCLYIIDPGSEPAKILREIDRNKFNDYRILLTHGHVDHIGAVPELMKTLPVSKLYLHKDDLPLYKSPENCLLPWIPLVKNLPEPSNEIENCEFRIIHTPGHTRGAVCFLFERINALFSGDTIFHCSVGRTDLPGGSQESLMKSIREKIFKLPDSMEIFAGHGQPTTVGFEKANNPYVQ
ncbi:MAG: MBL fold metallo-hydrolase [Victivallales bacterium]|jgi:glyoxylase-like metal-dependent hydrolase (beta-lactamase superfamily II)